MHRRQSKVVAALVIAGWVARHAAVLAVLVWAAVVLVPLVPALGILLAALAGGYLGEVARRVRATFLALRARRVLLEQIVKAGTAQAVARFEDELRRSAGGSL